MKRVIFALGVLFVFACSKTEVPAIPPVVVVPEEAIKFTTNLDTGTYNVTDTLPLVISVSSKLDPLSTHARFHSSLGQIVARFYLGKTTGTRG